MNKKLVTIALGAVVVIGGIFTYNVINNHNAKQIVLPYGKGRGVEGDIGSFNPTQADNTPSAIGLHNEIAELMAFDKNGKLVPYAAEKITTSKDGKEIDIKLKDGLKYEDNTEVKAQDYVNGAKLLAMPESKSSYQMWATEWVQGGADFASGKTKEISGFSAINDKEIKIKLTAPRAYFTSTFASEMWAPIPDKFISKIGGLKNYGKDVKSFISSGPLKIKSYKNGSSLDLVKNNASVLAKDAKVDAIKFVPVSTYSNAILQYKQNKLYAVEKSLNADKVLNKNTKANQEFSMPQVEYISVNRKSISKDLAKAIYLSLDKKYINDYFFDGMNQVRNVFTPDVYDNVEQGIKKQNVDPNKNEFDFKQAQTLAKQFKGKTIRLLLKEEKQQQNQYAAYTKYVISQMEKLGLKVEVKSLPTKMANIEVYKSANDERSYDLVLNAWSNDYPEASTFINSILGTHTKTNFSAWTSSLYDNATQKAMQTTDETKAGELYAKAVIDAKNNYAILPIVQYKANIYTQDGKYKPYSVAGIKYVNYW